MKNLSWRMAVLPLFLIGLSACGTRPARLQPPNNEKMPYYPRAYPDAKTIDNGHPVQPPAPPPSGNTVTISASPPATSPPAPVATGTTGTTEPGKSSAASSP